MQNAPIPPCLASHWQQSFNLESHLQGFLKLDEMTLTQTLQERRHAVAEIGQHFDWAMVADFYRDQVGSAYLFELAAWHLESHDYIGDTLRLVADFAQGDVLDFGCGIGTHAIAAALCPAVTHVHCVDLNPVNLEFIHYRAEQLGIGQKFNFSHTVPPEITFNTICCFDVMEHLPNPSDQLLEFHQCMNADGKLLINWYFSKGFGQEFPFHLDDVQQVTLFFQTLQTHFLEVFHPYLITARCYQPTS